jgi:hypothetical protein
MLRPASWLALLSRTFTFELSLAGSPRTNVEYDYVGKQSSPTTGLSPASPTALWAAVQSLTPRSAPDTAKRPGRSLPDPFESHERPDLVDVASLIVADLLSLLDFQCFDFVSGIWDADRAPHIRLAFAVASEQSDQADGVQTVGLGTPGATIHLDTRRVDDHIVDAVSI